MITTPSRSKHLSIRNHNQPDFDKIAVSQISEIYKEDVNISIWKRKLNESLIFIALLGCSLIFLSIILAELVSEQHLKKVVNFFLKAQ